MAVAENSLAQYWNPAGIARQKNFDLEIPVGLRAEFTGGLLKDVNTVGELADKFSKVQSAQKNGTSVDLDQISSVFQTLSTLSGLNDPSKGVLVDAQGGLNLRIMRFEISVNNFTSVGARPYADTVNIGLGPNAVLGNSGISFNGANVANPPTAAETSARDQIVGPINDISLATLNQITGNALSNAGITNATQLANALVNAGVKNGLTDQQILSDAAQIQQSEPAAKTIIRNAASGNSYSSNQSNVTLRGISLTEIAAGYAHKFYLKDLYIGGNLKALVGQVGYFQEQFLNKTVSNQNATADIGTNTKQTIQPGVDLGLLYDKRMSWRMKFGVVGRNLNNPAFDQPAVAVGEAPYRVQPQVRAGVALYPFKRTFWVLASDLDLTNNITPVAGYSSRLWGLGTEFNIVNSNLFNIALRAGLMKNLSADNSQWTYTGGMGFKLFHLFVDASGAVSSQTEQVKSGVNASQTVPQNIQAGVSLGLVF